MERNAETVQKALDWLDSLVGNSNDSDMALFTYQLLGILYDTCEELTEENERLRADVADLRDELECEKETNAHLCSQYMSENHLRHQAEEMLANGMSVVKADTVRKMQTFIEEKADICDLCLNKSNNSVDIIYQISKKQLDQIAKEMVEGENEN